MIIFKEGMTFFALIIEYTMIKNNKNLFVFQVKKLQNLAYQLGQEESKEMTRGKYLNILRRRN